MLSIYTLDNEAPTSEYTRTRVASCNKTHYSSDYHTTHLSEREGVGLDVDVALVRQRHAPTRLQRCLERRLQELQHDQHTCVESG
jgi:hypothetical protein